MELWVGALNLGLLYAFMTMGVFITFRIHDFHFFSKKKRGNYVFSCIKSTPSEAATVNKHSLFSGELY